MPIIELCGMPRAGKTTQRKALEDALQRAGHRIRVCQRPHVTFEKAGSLEQFHTIYIDSLVQAVGEYREDGNTYLIFDRGPYDRGVFLALDEEQGYIPSAFATAGQHTLAEIQKRVDFAYLLLISPEESFKRHPAQIRDGLDNQHLNVGLPSYDVDLEKMYTKYRKYLQLASDHPEVKIINCEGTRDVVLAKILKPLYERGSL